MLIVPVQPVPNQTLNIVLNSQPTTIELASTIYGVFMSVYLNGSLVIGGVLALQAVRIIRESYLGFSGDFVWIESQPDISFGPQNPSYPGLGSRFLLLYLTPADLASIGVPALGD